MSGVFVAGVSMTRFGSLLDDGIKSLTRSALREALEDAGATADQIEIAFFSNELQGVVEGQVSIPGQIALAHAGLTKIPVLNIENACASGSSAFWLACAQVRSGAVDIALAIGAEKMLFADTERRQRVAAAFSGGMDVYDQGETLANLQKYGAAIQGDSGTGPRTVMMDVYASGCRGHMARFGTTRRQLAVIASKNHDHAAHNDRCQYNKPISVDEVLAGRALAYPLTVPMCAPFSDGGSAAIVCNSRGLQKCGSMLANSYRLRSATGRNSKITSHAVPHLPLTRRRESDRKMWIWPKCMTRRPSASC
jgi:acetyl-CoA acyltransferase